MKIPSEEGCETLRSLQLSKLGDEEGVTATRCQKNRAMGGCGKVSVGHWQEHAVYLEAEVLDTSVVLLLSSGCLLILQKKTGCSRPLKARVFLILSM